jgi:hypothetical protein
MKKLLTLGLLSLAALAFTTGSASAWPFFGKCNQCCTTICLRQYNAFSPICCGDVNMGCCPINLNGCCRFGMGGGNQCYGGAGYGGGACYAGSGDACCLGELPAPGMMSTPAAAGAPNFQAPLPNPNQGPQPLSYGGMPMCNPYFPYVQPAAYAPMMQQTPYYWNAGGR